MIYTINYSNLQIQSNPNIFFQNSIPNSIKKTTKYKPSMDMEY